MAQSLNLLQDSENRQPFSGWPMIIAWAAMLLFACHACTRMVAAGDTWVAMACGRHFVNHGVNTVEPFSNNSHKAGPTAQTMADYAEQLRQSVDNKEGLKASITRWCADKADNFGNWPKWLQSFTKWIHPTGWVNQNWLTHIIFYELVPKSTYTPSDTFSSNALVYWKFAVYILIVICVYYTGKVLGVNPALSAAFTCFAIFTGRTYFDIRPAGFSNLLVAVYLLVLVISTYRNVLYIWLIVPLTILWCNLHGGYIYLFITIIPFIGIHLLLNLSRKWSLILYNLIAWPAFFLYSSGIDFEAIPLEEQWDTAFSIYLFLFVCIAMEVCLVAFRDKFVKLGRKGIYHSIAAAAVAFFGAILFNPFHLTNFTHTLVISISEHAKMWRTVYEWHPAFEWDNKVGTAYPFLIMVILFIAVFIFWLVSRLLFPKALSAPKDMLDRQKRTFTTMLKVFGFALAVFLFWLTLLSFSFIDYDRVSFAICVSFAAVLLISIYKNSLFIFLAVPLVFISMKLSNANPTFEGRYIYSFVLLPSFAAMSLIASQFSKKLKLKILDIVFVTASAITCLMLTVFYFNPFKTVTGLPSLTGHAFFEWLGTFGDYLLKNLAAAKPVWHPAFINNAAPSYDKLFAVLYAVNFLSIAAWLASFFTGRTNEQPEADTARKPSPQQQYSLPKIDLALLIISALTVYMALKSRRFIPIAAIAACPFIALLAEQVIRTVAASLNFHTGSLLAVGTMPKKIEQFFIIAAAFTVAFLGTWWGIKYKKIYLDPWPTDKRFNTVFMRMTASDAKPFYAMKFIKDNNLAGEMFNYWTEGGFIAWGQNPDPNTGRIPLQLFMDGRAQAAYEPSAFYVWNTIINGGPEAERARSLRVTPDFSKVGKWIDRQLKNNNVWITLMPAEQFDEDFVRGLHTHPDWYLIYYDIKQRIYVDITTPRGKQLLNGIFDGKTIYPNEFTKDLAFSFYRLMYKEPQQQKEGFDYAVRAYNIEPSQPPMDRILYASKYEHLRPEILTFCKNVVDDFEANQNVYRKRDGFHNRLVAAFIAAGYLQRIAANANNIESAADYFDKAKRYEAERIDVMNSIQW